MQLALVAALANRQEGVGARAAGRETASLAGGSSIAEQADLLGADGLLAQWAAWAQAGGGQDEKRMAAVTAVRKWLAQGAPDQPLNLSGLGLTRVPDAIPPSVRVLWLEQNQLTELPALPPGLRDLDLRNNLLISLPERLPDSIEKLNLDENRLVRLPERLPANLQELFVQNNRLVALPGSLPDGLNTLLAAENRLTALPENLPRSLRHLNVAQNQIAGLPDDLPTSLRFVIASTNQLTRLPESLVTLHWDCIIRLEDNPLPHRVCARLERRINKASHEVPQVHFRPLAVSALLPQRPLLIAVANWVVLASPNCFQSLLSWQTFSGEDGAAAFSGFLDRLAIMVGARNTAFQRSIGEWLVHLENRHQLRRQTFLVSEGASASCDDRILLTLNAMRQLRLACDVEAGEYDQRLPDLLTLARGMFRLDQLEAIAREKAGSLNFVDEIEVYLAYQVKLRDALLLPLGAPDMPFSCDFYVMQSDLYQARDRVLAAEQEHFADYLSTDWQPWQAVLQRLDRAGHERTQAALVDAMGDEFAARLQARLQAVGLERDPDAERIVGGQLRTEIAYEINGRLTRDFLARHGLQNHLPAG